MFVKPARLLHLMLLAVIFTPACSKSPTLDAPTKVLTAYRAFPSTTDAKTEANRPLDVTMTRPTGAVGSVSAITVAFNHGMVEPSMGEKPATKPIFRIEPAVDGEFRWMGSRTAVFHPDKPLPSAMRFQVTVPAGTKSLDGHALGRDHTFKFHTRFLKIFRASLSPYDRKLRPDSTIQLELSLSVEPSALRKATTLTRDGKPVDITVERVKSYGNLYFYGIKPSGGFAFGSRYALKVSGALKPPSGNLTLSAGLEDTLKHASPRARRRYEHVYAGGDYHAEFDSYGDFTAVDVKCGVEMCTRGNYWRVKLSNPVDPKSVDKCLSLPKGVHAQSVDAYGTEIDFVPAGVEGGHRYTIGLTTQCKDIFGNQLSRARRFTVQLGHDRPMLMLDGGLRVLEYDAKKPAAVPVTVENTHHTRARMYRVPASQLAYMVAHFQAVQGPDDKPHGGALGEPVIQHLDAGRIDERKVHALNLSRALGNAKTGAVYFDVYTPDLKTRWDNGMRRSLVVVTDLGMTIKEASGGDLVWVTRLSTGKPVANATVDLWNADSEKTWTGKTNSDGLVEAPTSLFAGDQGKPVALTATVGDDTTVLDLQDWQGRVSAYRFGFPYATSQGPLRTRNFIFTDRGVYRAGETVHIKGYMRLEKDGVLHKMPASDVDLSVKDSRGNIVALDDAELTDLGGFSLDVDLPKDASLGTYTITVEPDEPTLDGHLQKGTTGSFRVEAYRPPRFETLVEPTQDELVVGHHTRVKLRGRYLFGAPMRGAKVTWTARRMRTQFQPASFKDFSFVGDKGEYWWYYDASHSRQIASGSGKLDDDGELDAKLDIPKNDDFTGPQSVEVEASVTDVDRQTLSGRATIRVHPGEYYVGVRQPNYLVAASDTVEPKAIAVDYEGRPLSGKPIELEVLRRTWKSVQKKAAGGGYTWVTEHTDESAGKCTFKSAKAPRGCKFTIPGPGSYVVEATSTDGLGNELSSITHFYAYGKGDYWWGRHDDERIDLVADANQYKVGETAKIMVQSPFKKAKALVTVERESVIERFVTDIDGTTGVVEIPVTEKMQPNAYVSVSLVRGRVHVTHAHQKQTGTSTPDPGRPAFKIGYAELKVDHADKKLHVDLEPDSQEYRPGGLVRTNIALTDAHGKPTAGEVTFMAVDQGVLSLTGYKTPDPTQAFYAERPLGVSNRDSRLMLTTRAELEAAQKSMANKAGTGGDGGSLGTSYRNKFATTAAFRSTVEVGADGKATVEFHLPDNLTSYRLMAVAAADHDRFGAGEKRIRVNKPLMVRPALPRFASTGDHFEARAVIQALDKRGGRVSVTVDTDGPLELTGQKTAEFTLKPGAAKEVAFPVVAGLPGDAKVRFRVAGQGDVSGKDAVEVTLPVKYPSAKTQYVESGTLTMDASFSQSDLRRRIELPEGVRTDVGGLEVDLSSSAVGELIPGLNYLVDYPYGCVEQVTGRTLPLVSMRQTIGKLGLPGLHDKDIAHFAQTGLDRLFEMQTPDGGLGYWPGASQAHPWGSVYGALAAVRAKHEGGYHIDADKYSKLMGYLSHVLRGNVQLPSYWMREKASLLPTQAFAAWVLAEAGQPQPSYHTRLYNQRHDLPDFARAFLAMAIDEAGDSPKYRDALMDDLVDQVVEESDGTAHLRRGPEGSAWWLYWVTPTRSDAIMLMALLRIRPNSALIPKIARHLLEKRYRGRWQNTQDTAFSILALSEYFKREQGVKPDYEALVGLGKTPMARESFHKAELRPRRIFIPMAKLAAHQGQLLTIARRGPGGPMYYTAKLSYVKKKPPTTAFDGGLHLTRQYVAVDGKRAGKPIEKVRPGQVIKVQLSLTVPQRGEYVAVEDPLPAGFEPINTSFATTSSKLTKEAYSANDADWRYAWWWYYWPMSFEHTEQHDDRVLLFANEVDPGVYRYAYLARATTPGTFTAPAARVEQMYEPLIFGRTDAATVTIR